MHALSEQFIVAWGNRDPLAINRVFWGDRGCPTMDQDRPRFLHEQGHAGLKFKIVAVVSLDSPYG